MGVSSYFKRRVRFRKFWLNLKGWQKGGIIGLLITLVLSILLGLISGHLFFSLIYFIILAIPIISFGVIINYINKKLRLYIFYGGIIGLVFGFSYTFILYYLPKSFERFNGIITFPIYYLTRFIFSFLNSESSSEGNIALVLIYLFISTFLLCLIGIVIGFMIYLIKKGLKR